jgi:hypothetical protein
MVSLLPVVRERAAASAIAWALRPSSGDGVMASPCSRVVTK